MIHSTAEVSDAASIGFPGDRVGAKADTALVLSIGARTVIREFCVIKGSLVNDQYGTTIGDDCWLFTGVHVYEGCRIRHHVEINVQATLCGYVDVFPHARIGARAVIHPGVTIGEWALVGLGAVVIEDVPPGAIVYGNPARIASYRSVADMDQAFREWKRVKRRKPMSTE